MRDYYKIVMYANYNNTRHVYINQNSITQLLIPLNPLFSGRERQAE